MKICKVCGGEGQGQPFVDESNGRVDGLSLKSFYFLFSGGAMTGGGALPLAEARRWRDAIPLVSLFGGAIFGGALPGKCKIDKAQPICEETAHVLPSRFADGGLQSIWDLCQEEAYTRKDDEKDENLRYLIKPEVRALLEDEHAEKDKVRGTDEDVAGDTGVKQQMRYYVETLAAGSKLFWSITLEDVTDLEFEAFAVALAEFGRVPYIGGKSGVGHGKVAIQFDNWIAIEPRTAPRGEEISLPLGNRYMQHLQAHGDEIREILDGLQ